MAYDQELVKINDVILHVVKAGPLDGEPVILLHGFPEFWYGWRHQIDALANAGYRVIVPDQRGYNRSDKPKPVSEYAIEKLIGDVNALIRWTGHDSAVVIGHDWGAAVAWWLALTYPRRVKKLGILNVPHPVVHARFLRENFGQLLKSWYAIGFQVPWLPETTMAIGNYAVLAQSVKSTAKATTFSREEMDVYREAWSRPGALRSMINWYRAFVQNPPPPPEDPRLKMPVLMIWGMQDFALSSDMAQPSIDFCDNGRLVKISDATHWVQHDASAQVSELLLEFLGK